MTEARLAIKFLSLLLFFWGSLFHELKAQEPLFSIEEIDEQIQQLPKNNTDTILTIVRPYLDKAKAANWTLGEVFGNYYFAYVYATKNKYDQATPLLYRNLDLLATMPAPKAADSIQLKFHGNTLIRLAEVSYYTGKTDSVMHYANEALNVLENTNYLAEIVDAKNFIGAIYYGRGELQKTTEVFKECLQIQQQLGNQKGVARMYNNLGVLAKSMGNLNEALNYYLKGLELSRELNNIHQQITCLTNSSQIYFQLKEYDRAMNVLQEAKQLAEQYNNESLIADVLDDLGDVHKELGNSDSAYHYYQKSLTIYQQIDFQGNVAYVNERLSSLLIEENRLEAAKSHIDQGLAIAKEINIPYDETLLYCRLLEYYLQKKQPSKALQANQKLLTLIKQTEDYDLQKTAYGVIYRVFEANGQHKQALEYLKKHMTASDSITHIDRTRDIARIEYSFELKQKTQQLEAQQRQQTLVYQQELEKQQWMKLAAFGVTFFVIVIAAILYRSFQIKKRDNEVLSHQSEMLELKNEELQVLYEKEQAMIEKERELMQESIAIKERQLATGTMLSHEKNALFNQLLNYFQQLKSDVSDEGYKKVLEATKLIRANLNMQNSWENFVYQFENVHPHFFKRMKEAYPAITPKELKFASYIKIGFNNKDIAQVANMSNDAVKKGLYRLKKRLNLAPNDDLRTFILQFS
ncbi:MAG: tetratricopeptide repeat protein [Flammeovirgaceae bacterium]